MSKMTKAEKIETVVSGWLQYRTPKGTCGSIAETGPGRYRVDTEDGEFIVCSTGVGWSITEPGQGMIAEAPMLLEAGTLYFEERI